MNITRDHVKESVGFVSAFGGGALTGTALTPTILAIPNPFVRIAAFVGSMGLGVVVGKAAKQGTDELIDSVCDIVDEIKNR